VFTEEFFVENNSRMDALIWHEYHQTGVIKWTLLCWTK